MSPTIGFSTEWIEIGDIILFPEDRKLLESGGWLNDKHINAAQTLLKVQHSHISSLQNTLLQQIDGFQVQGNKVFVQCLNLQICSIKQVAMTVDYLLWPQPVLFVMDMIHPLLQLNKNL